MLLAPELNCRRSLHRGRAVGLSSNRQDITRDTSLSVNWQAHDQLALSASLQTASRGVNQAGLDYDSTMLFITAQLTY